MHVQISERSRVLVLRLNTGDDIARYGAEVTERIRGWWDSNEDKGCVKRVATYYGDQPFSNVLER